MGRQRYWNGHSWTAESRPWQRTITAEPPQSPPATNARSPRQESGLRVRYPTLQPNPNKQQPPLAISAPASTFPAETETTADGSPFAGHRTIHVGIWPTIAMVTALIPLLAGALGIVGPIAFGLHLAWPTWGSVIPFAAWCAMVPVITTTRFDGLLRHVHRCRDMTAAERWRLAQPWRRVLQRAGVPPGKYRLMITETSDLNACRVGPGRVVIAPSDAASQGYPEAILAHELGHRFGRASVVEMVRAQLVLPIHAVFLLLRSTWSPVAPMWRRAVAWHRPIGFLLTFLLAIIAAAVSLVLAAPAALAWSAVALAQLSDGQRELQADAMAVRLGFGAEMLAALELTIEDRRHDDRSGPFSSPPALPMPLVRRARRLRKTLSAAGT